MSSTDPRQHMIDMFQAGVAAADPEQAVRLALAERPVAPVTGRTLILAIGKAAHGMLRGAAREKLGTHSAIVVTNYENHQEIEGVDCFAAGHPVPDENGLAAGKAVRAALQSLGAEDQVLALISGGGSALLPGPAEGLELADKAEVNRLLLGCGADIVETNIVRQGLSQFKGGGLLALAAPASVRSLILSDVVGDDLRVIASGPTVAPITDRAGARAVAERLGIWDQMPAAARAVLMVPRPFPDLPAPDARLVGSNAISVAAMAATTDHPFEVMDTPLTGDVAEAAALILQKAKTLPAGTALLMGGETTVVLRGDGRGGRNQELALRVAMLAEEQGFSGDWSFLSGGTDGRDGPTDAAGAIVGPKTLAKIRAAGQDPQALLENSDSYAALSSAEDLLITGATGTNVADLQIFLRLTT